MVSMTCKFCTNKKNKGHKIWKSFAIKKIMNPTKDGIKEIAYNIFKNNKQSSQTDTILNQKSSFVGSILRRDAFYIIMNKIEVSLQNVIDTCKKNNLMMVVDEDILKFLILRMFQQLAILREAGASHGDVKPDNIMLNYEADQETVKLNSADVQLIDFGCTGPNGAHYGATGGYTPLDAWRKGINDQTATSMYKSSQTTDSKTSKKLLRTRKNGSKFDSWSSFITLLEFINFSHPFQDALNSGNYLKELSNFKFNKKMIHFSNTYSRELLELFEKVLTVETEIIDAEEVPIRWGVEEVIASDFYKDIEKDSESLKRIFFVFLRIVYNYEEGLFYLLHLSEKNIAERSIKEVIKFYSNLQEGLFNNSFTELNSPVIDHSLRNALRYDEHYNGKYPINDYFSTKKSHANLLNFDFSKRSEFSIIARNNLVADKEKISQMLKYYEVYRKILYPEFYVDDRVLVDCFQYDCIKSISHYSSVVTEILKFNDNFKSLGLSSKNEVDFALRNFNIWEFQRLQQKSLINNTVYPPPFDCLLTFNLNESTSHNSNTKTFKGATRKTKKNRLFSDFPAVLGRKMCQDTQRTRMGRFGDLDKNLLLGVSTGFFRSD